MAAQYVALKELSYDKHKLSPGEVIPNKWVEDWTELRALHRMMNLGQVQLVPAGTDPLPEGIPQYDDRYGPLGTPQVKPEAELGPEVTEALLVEELGAVGVAEAHLGDPQEAEPEVEVEEPEPEEEEDEEEPFDPSEYSANAVQNWVKLNPGTAAAVLELEEDGRKRKGLMNWLRQQVEEDAEE